VRRLLLITLMVVASTLMGVAQSSVAVAAGRAPGLGSKTYETLGGATGWGAVKPRQIFNGGDPSGHVSSLTWKGWGSSVALGTGKGFVFAPGGGYFPHQLREQLRASDVSRCTASGPRAYTRLEVRVPSRPGGPLGAWMPWGANGSIC
jgi:hypothetical protein